MKLAVKGIEEIEITDPAGLCNPPAPSPALPPSQPQVPEGETMYPAPNIGRPLRSGIPLPEVPFIGDHITPEVDVPRKSTIYTNQPGVPQAGKWGQGSQTIHQAASDIEKLLGERQREKDGNRNYH